MKSRNIIVLLSIIIITFGFIACTDNSLDKNNETNETVELEQNDSDLESDIESSTEVETSDKELNHGRIYIYGEMHANENINKKELEIWSDYYHNEGMRHLFIEAPYYTAEYLNIWMQADNDDILLEVYDDFAGTQAHTPLTLDFYRTIKETCPETIFHGTDVGHQYATTGQRYIRYLLLNSLQDTEYNKLAIENINQGKFYYDNNDHEYRENMMTENFIREFNRLGGEDIMGIYGTSHTDLTGQAHYDDMPSMANQLNVYYPEIVESTDLSYFSKAIEPEYTETIEVAGKTYVASYYGEQDLEGWKDFKYRKFWRLEDAYEDFKDNSVWDVVPYTNFPMQIEQGQVFVLEFGMLDGSIEYAYCRSDGDTWKGMLTNSVFSLEPREMIEVPIEIQTLSINGKDYDAAYYGKVDYKAGVGCEYIEYWHVVDAYDDLKTLETIDNTILSNYYPIPIEVGEVYIVDFALEDGTHMKTIMRSDGEMLNGKMVTIELDIK